MYMLEKNFPARGLAKRLGFRQEGLIEDLVMQDGVPANVVYFGLTRKNHAFLTNPELSSPEQVSSDLAVVGVAEG
jgi:hypothetical protein